MFVVLSILSHLAGSYTFSEKESFRERGEMLSIKVETYFQHREKKVKRVGYPSKYKYLAETLKAVESGAKRGEGGETREDCYIIFNTSSSIFGKH